LARLLDNPDATKLAAITSKLTGDGLNPPDRNDDDSGAPAKTAPVLCNPEVFATMDDRAAQVVMTHEATHALTGAIGRSAPQWVIEGFADWVALHDDSADLSQSAGQILQRVAEEGPPQQL